MLKVGTDLFSAINILIDNFTAPAMRGVLIEIRDGLERGEPFHATFAKYPRYFSPVFVSLVSAGESSGTLERSFDELSVELEKEQNLRNNIKSALVYPAILFVMASLILLFLVTFALPKIAKVFESSGFNPPLFSRVIFAIGLFMGEYAVLIFILFFAGLTGFFFFLKTARGAQILSALFTRLPVIKSVAEKIAIQRFTGTVGLLLTAGIPVVESLDTAADVVSHTAIKRGLHRVAHEGLTRGLTLGDAFKREAVLPPVVNNLIGISEKAGHLSEVLKTIATFYETEVANSLKRLVTFLEPVMLLVIGSVIGLIALSIIIPVYQLVGQIQ